MKKLLSVLLTLVMLVSLFGAFPAFAEGESASQYVAQVISSGGSAANYTSFKEAWKAAVDGKATFKLLTNWRLEGSVQDFGEDETNQINKAVYFNGGALSVPSGKSVTIDLNGWEINRNKSYSTMTDNGSVIRLFDGASLTIDDSSEDMTGAIMGGRSTYGGGIYAPLNNIVTLNGGRICLNNGYYGGGVYLDSSSKLTLNGGSIDNNLSYYGGGVYAEDDAVFETHGGVISLNRATYDGGGIYLWSAKASLDNCTVENNSAKNGGAIFSDYNVFKSYSRLEVNNSRIINNTADNYYGGIYHCAGRISLEGNTRITGNKNKGNYGGGVYSQKVSVYLSGNVQVYGNYFKGDEPCDVNFGKSLEEAFILKGNMWGNALIGVYATNATTPTYWCRDYHLYVNCTNTDDNVKSLAKCLFSNSGTGGFVYKDEIRSHLQDRTWHYTMIKSEGNAPKYDVTVTQVSYKDVILSPSEYSFNYNYKSRTVNLNLPNYVKEPERLQVNALANADPIEFDLGAGVDISNGQALVVNTSNPSTKYTVTVDGGTIDGTDKTEMSKLYLEPFGIAPAVPDGKVFSHWEIIGDDDNVPGFEKYAKSPANLEMPKHNVTFKAVLKDKVSVIDITLEEPKAGEKLSDNTKASVSYSVNGKEEKAEADVIWRKNSYDGKNEKFDYNSSYNASFNFGDSPDGDFGLADANKLKIYLNGTELLKENYRYLNHFENGGGIYETAKDSDPVKEHIVYITYPYQTAKANVLTVESPTIEIPSDTSVEELKNLLPDSVKITYEGIDSNKTASAPVSWGELPTSISDKFTINGTVTIPEALEATEEQKKTTITVTISGKTRLQKPSASVKDGGTMARNE
ncbi:MAG: right-handed parallel beta-helix repeat-containing protein, partial [Clostridia bacterium]|nr:right-handed parallel beta-helix repeat-containing protein [Clostridia bacterium]